ncbi:MAG: segregation/condensation protein A [Nitrospirae bacterium]|nr:segregation/condensation protein A [Nitrospirota bacterium]
MPETSYSIKLPLFEGPLDLLLHLIRENKIDIYDIPIAEITRQYIAYLDLMKELNLEIAGEFIVMAATLIQIKTRMLLPVDEDVPPEEREDPRIELVERLIEYQAFKSVAFDLKERQERWSDYFWRDPALPETEEAEEQQFLFDVNVFDLIAAFKKLMETAPPEVVAITRETLTVKDRMNLITEKLEPEKTLRFEDIFEGDHTPAQFIVTFLALLELLRLGVVRVYQERPFGQIWILWPETADEATEKGFLRE